MTLKVTDNQYGTSAILAIAGLLVFCAILCTRRRDEHLPDYWR